MSYPSAREIERLEAWPPRIELEDLRRSFALSDLDRELVFEQRGAASRLGLAAQLCALRFVGFIPEDLAVVPRPALQFLCDQMLCEPHELLDYGAREQTRSDHLGLIRDHLGFRPWDEAAAADLEAWLVDRALEHERPSVLMALTGEHLRARRIVRPTVRVLARMIAAARRGAHEMVPRLLASQLGTERCEELDGLLEPAADRRTCELVWLREPIGRVGAKGALAQVAKYERLQELSADQVDLSRLPPSRRAQLAARAGRLDAHQLKRRPGRGTDGAAAHRHAIVLVALAELHVQRGDELLDVLGKLLANAQRRARTKVDVSRRQSARARDDLAALGASLSRIVLQERDAGRDPTARIAREVGLDRLRAAAGVTDAHLPPLEREQLDVLHAGHSSLAPPLRAILDTVTLNAREADQPLLDAVALVAAHRRRRLLAGADVGLLRREHRAWVIDDRGRVLRSRYEPGAVVRDRRRASRRPAVPAGQSQVPRPGRVPYAPARMGPGTGGARRHIRPAPGPRPAPRAASGRAGPAHPARPGRRPGGRPGSG